MEYSKEVIDLVWEMAFEIEGKDPSIYRKDKCGATIRKDLLNTTNTYGWIINHIHPISCGGIEFFTNYQPLHWKNHESKGEGPDFPHVYCVWNK
ncbi:MAG: HNH endonuclease [Candidatus Izemoplasmatales bacterium]